MSVLAGQEQLSTWEDITDEGLAYMARKDPSSAPTRAMQMLFQEARRELPMTVNPDDEDFISGIDRKPPIMGYINPDEMGIDTEAKLEAYDNQNVNMVQNAVTAEANEVTKYQPGRGSIPFATSSAALQFGRRRLVGSMDPSRIAHRASRREDVVPSSLESRSFQQVVAIVADIVGAKQSDIKDFVRSQVSAGASIDDIVEELESRQGIQKTAGERQSGAKAEEPSMTSEERADFPR
jgi:hypothetical protein